jgi:hypothetical protein
LLAAKKDQLFLLMTVLSQTLLTFVGSHFVLFSFLSAWHRNFSICGFGYLPGPVKQLF